MSSPAPNFRVHVGRVEDVAPTLEGPFDAVLCDPPYGLEFMGKAWDRGVPPAEVWREVAQLLRPGAHVAAFGGTRTYHLLATALEDAGLAIRDCLSWLYGSGFPKSHSLDDRFGGYGTALKPAWEPCVLAQAPLQGTYAENALAHGVAGLNLEAGRVGRERTLTRRNGDSGGRGALGRDERKFVRLNPPGRWPANVALDELAAEQLDEQSGELTSGANPTRRSSSKFGATYGDFEGSRECRAARGADSGGASRFFYVAKVATAERNAGLEAGDPCRHPTLKPVRLVEWLAKLLLPPPRLDGAPRRLLVPFSGAGSEIAGALRAGWDEVVGIEQSPEYSAWAERRVPALVRLDFEASRSSSLADLPGQGLLFDEGAA